MSSSGSSSAVGARLRAMVDGLGERSALLGAMEGQYLAKALKWAVERWQSAGCFGSRRPGDSF